MFKRIEELKNKPEYLDKSAALITITERLLQRKKEPRIFVRVEGGLKHGTKQRFYSLNNQKKENIRTALEDIMRLLLGLMMIIFGLNIGLVLAQDNPVERRIKMEKYISAQIEAENYCNASEDCMVVNFGCPFGCESYVNKDVDFKGLKTKISRYHKQYGECVYRCLKVVNPVCVNNKCVEKKCEVNKEYAPFDCRCPEGTAQSYVTDKENQSKNTMKCVFVN